MKKLTLHQVAKAVGGKYIGEETGALVEDIVLDSRRVKKGGLFIAIAGEKSDGHDYIRESLVKGACCAVSEKPLEDPGGPYILVDSARAALRDLAEYYRSLFDVKVIGVTGSVGKTTTKEMLDAVLSQRYAVHKTAGNYNNEVGVPLTLFGLREAHRVAIVEMGISGFGEMRRLTKMVRPDIVVMSAIGDAHLEFLGSRAGVLKAKGEIFEYAGRSCLAVVNGDDDLLRDMAPADFRGDSPNMKKRTYGLEQWNDFRAGAVENLGGDGINCVIHGGKGSFPVHIPAFGSHMVYAALAAAAVGESLDLTADEIRAGIAAFQNVGRRADITKTGYITLIDDCYNANPNSVMAAIDSLAALPGRRVCILGDMGELGKEVAALHEKVGRHAAAAGIDCVVCVGRLAENIYRGVRAASAGPEARHFPQKEDAVAALPGLIKRGDTILVKASRSMRFEEVVSALKTLGLEL